MKKVILALVFLLSRDLSAQNFTNGSVYDFNVGDTIVTSYTHLNGSTSASEPPMYTYRVFINKSYSANQDTVFYTAHDVISGFTCSPCGPNYTSYVPIIVAGTVTFAVTNLTLSTINFAFATGPCGRRVDTSYVNECGMNEHHTYMNYSPPNNNCFEPPTLDYHIIEGVGIFEHVFYLNTFPMQGDKTELLWFRKGNKRCGNASMIPDGIREWNTENEKLQVYPNPSDGNYTVEIKNKGMLSVENLLGENAYRSPVSEGKNKVDLASLPSGVYVMKCQSENKIFTSRVIKK